MRRNSLATGRKPSGTALQDIARLILNVWRRIWSHLLGIWKPSEGAAGAVEHLEARVCQAEARLGLSLPADYVSFVARAARWPTVALSVEDRFLALDEVELYRDRYPWQLEMWMENEELLGGKIQVGVYGPDQRPELFSLMHLRQCVAITTHARSGVYVLNPAVKTGDLWEAWVLDFQLPGAMRFPSFFGLVEYEIPRSVAELESALGPSI
jgi:hypothetical protein